MSKHTNHKHDAPPDETPPDDAPPAVPLPELVATAFDKLIEACKAEPHSISKDRTLSAIELAKNECLAAVNRG